MTNVNASANDGVQRLLGVMDGGRLVWKSGNWIVFWRSRDNYLRRCVYFGRKQRVGFSI